MVAISATSHRDRKASMATRLVFACPARTRTLLRLLSNRFNSRAAVGHDMLVRLAPGRQPILRGAQQCVAAASPVKLRPNALLRKTAESGIRRHGRRLARAATGGTEHRRFPTPRPDGRI